VLAVVKDLFFVARIRETARLTGVPVVFARTPEDVGQAVSAPASGSHQAPAFALLDLTSGLDHAAILSELERAGVPVLAFTTHALARQTQPWHGRCQRVVTKEVLTRELGAILQRGLP